jgi:hypothetical protein
MLIRLLGPDVPEPMLKAFAATTDHAKVRSAEVQYDQVAATVLVPLRLARAISRSWLAGFKYSAADPARSRLLLRHVTAYKIDVLAVGPIPAEVELLFGIQIETDRLWACSAEEYHGQDCFAIDVAFAGLDLELTTEPHTAQQP